MKEDIFKFLFLSLNDAGKKYVIKIMKMHFLFLLHIVFSVEFSNFAICAT